MSDELHTFARRFLTGRMRWHDTPRLNAIINFGNIISLLLYRKPPFQVELFIVPYASSSFTEHTHPDVDVVEFGLCGDVDLIVNGQPPHTRAQIQQWLQGNIQTSSVYIDHTALHSGCGYTPYAFLSIQHWLNGVQPTSVGLNWQGQPSSAEQEALWENEGQSYG